MIVEIEKRYKVAYDVDDITTEEYKKMTDSERLRIIETLDVCAYSREISETEAVNAEVFVGKIDSYRLKIDEFPLKVAEWNDMQLRMSEWSLIANGYRKAAKAIRCAIRDRRLTAKI